MIKLMTVDSSGNVPYPEVSNLNSSALEGLITIGGQRLQGRFPQLTLVLEDAPEASPGLVDYFTVGLITIVSTKMRMVLEQNAAEVEFFPVLVLYQGVKTPIQYFAANPTNLIRAVDLERSIVELDDELGDCVSVQKLVLKESAFYGLRLAALAEIPYIGVQEDLARNIELSGCIGCDFLDPLAVRY